MSLLIQICCCTYQQQRCPLLLKSTHKLVKFRKRKHSRTIQEVCRRPYSLWRSDDLTNLIPRARPDTHYVAACFSTRARIEIPFIGREEAYRRMSKIKFSHQHSEYSRESKAKALYERKIWNAPSCFQANFNRDWRAVERGERKDALRSSQVENDGNRDFCCSCWWLH